MTMEHEEAEDPTGGVGINPGDLLGGDRYKVIKLLGTGGMGAVFEAVHQAINRRVAIKVLRAELAKDHQFAARFMQEARTANAVHSRNIVEIIDFGVDDGRPFMVMEYLHGKSLGHMYDASLPIAPRKLLPLLDPVMRALAGAHDKGIVHRDIKPDNIQLAEMDGEIVPKLLDFGIAKTDPKDGVRLTQTRMALGTPLYMAPEQATGAKDVTAAADQYAFGVMLYEAFSGRLPHEGDSFNAMIIAKATQPAPDLSTYCPNLDRGLIRVVMRALAMQPKDRFPNLSALREALLPFHSVDMAIDTGNLLETGNRPVSVTGLDSTGGLEATMASPITMAELLPGSTSDQIAAGNLLSTNVSMHERAEKKPNVDTLAEMPVATKTASSAVPNSRRTLFLGLAAVLVVGAVAVTFATRTSASSVASPPPVTSSPVVGAAKVDADAAVVPVVRQGKPEPVVQTPKVEQVVFRIRVTPANARIVVDNQDLGGGFTELIKPKDGHAYQLQLAAPGFTPITRVLRADDNQNFDLSLSPVAVPDAGVRPASSGAHNTGGHHPHTPAGGGHLGYDRIKPG